MSPEVLIIIFLSSLLLILLIIQFFFSNNGSKERIKILLEKQENLERSIYQIFDEKFEKIRYQNLVFISLLELNAAESVL